MLWLVLAMTIAVALAAFVVAVVALPARREGRFVLTPRGEQAFRVADERARAARTLATRRGEAKGAKRGTAKSPEAAQTAQPTAEKPPAQKAASAPAAAQTTENRSADAPRRRRLSRAKK